MSNSLQYTLSLKDLFSKTMSNAINSTQRLDSRMEQLTTGVSNFANVVGVGFSVSKIIDFGKAVVDSYTNFEYFHASLKTMLHGNENAAAALEQRLVTLAKTTPFELKDVQQATKQLMAYGFGAGEVVQQMRMLGDVSAGVGAPLGDIAYLYGTMRSSGHVTLMDLRQFGGRGIPIFETLAKRLKVTTGEINRMVHDGKIGFRDIEGAFQDMTKEGGQFFNLMSDQSKTLGGKISNLSDSWEQFKVNLGSTWSESLKETFSFLTDTLETINVRMAAVNKMSQTLNKSGFGLSFYEREIGTVNKGTYGIYQMVLESFSKSKLSDAQKIESLQKIAQAETKRFQGKEISALDYSRKIALIQGEIGTLKGEQSLSSMTSSAPDSIEKGGKSSSSLGTGTEVTGNRPQNLTININKLIETQEINSTTIEDSTSKIKEKVSKALLEAVNDVNLMQR